MTNKQKISGIREIYETAFPQDERRDFCELERLAATEKDMHIKISTNEDGKVSGFIIYWTFETFLYIEHFAINERFRGNGFGSVMLADFLKNAALPVILEVEPPDAGSIAVRRVKFYGRHGMSLHDFPYMQPPYSADKNPVAMRLMSFGNIDMARDFEQIRCVLYERVYGVKEGLIFA